MKSKDIFEGKLDEKGFVFIDQLRRAYNVRMWNDEPWLMYWHESGKHWVTLRLIDQAEIFSFAKMKISEDLAECYHELARGEK